MRIFQPLAVEFGREDAEARGVAAGPRHRVYQSLPDHILCNPEDRNHFRRLLCGVRCRTPTGIDDIDLGFDQPRRIRHQITVKRKIAVIDYEVLTFNKAEVAQFV
jgi:hypothetical protein